MEQRFAIIVGTRQKPHDLIMADSPRHQLVSSREIFVSLSGLMNRYSLIMYFCESTNISSFYLVRNCYLC